MYLDTVGQEYIVPLDITTNDNKWIDLSFSGIYSGALLFVQGRFGHLWYTIPVIRKSDQRVEQSIELDDNSSIGYDVNIINIDTIRVVLDKIIHGGVEVGINLEEEIFPDFIVDRTEW